MCGIPVRRFLLRWGRADRKRGRIRVGGRKGSLLQLCLKQAGGTGTSKGVCARIMDGWTYLKRIIED